MHFLNKAFCCPNIHLGTVFRSPRAVFEGLLLHCVEGKAGMLLGGIPQLSTGVHTVFLKVWSHHLVKRELSYSNWETSLL
jgi:hypothetical protein